MQFLGGTLAVIPCVAEKDIAIVRPGRLLLTLSRTGVRARTSADVYTTDEPDRDQRGLVPPLDPLLLLRPPPPLPQEDDGDE